jgi:hypothetical protein
MVRFSEKTIVLLAIVLFSVPGLGAEKPWREVRSPHFRVLTDGGEGAGRRVIVAFERMRAVFANAFPKYRLEGTEPLLILAPKDEGSTRKLAPGFWMPAYHGPKPAGIYIPSREQPCAVVRLDQEGHDRDEFATVYHEYVHSLSHVHVH